VLSVVCSIPNFPVDFLGSVKIQVEIGMTRSIHATKPIRDALEHHNNKHFEGKATLEYNWDSNILEVVKPNWALIINDNHRTQIVVCILEHTRLNVVVKCEKGVRKWINQAFPLMNELIQQAIQYTKEC